MADDENERAAHKDAWISGWMTGEGANARLKDAEEAYAYELAEYPESLAEWLVSLRVGIAAPDQNRPFMVGVVADMLSALVTPRSPSEPDAGTLREMARAYRGAWGKQEGEPSEWWWSQCEQGLLAAIAVRD